MSKRSLPYIVLWLDHSMRVIGWLVLATVLDLANGIDLAEDVVFVIVSQRNSFHAERASEKRDLWSNKLKTLTGTESSSSPRILLSHELELEAAAWTIAPLLPLLSPYISSTMWFFFALEETDVNFSKLQSVLDRYNPKKEVFLGHSLHDSSPTILHHYVTAKVLHYPNFPSGWALSAAAIKKVLDHITKFSPSFNIDPQYEFAQFLLYLRTLQVMELLPKPPPPPNDGIKLTHVPELCLSQQGPADCATTYQHTIPVCDGHGDLALNEVHFAIKTCLQFHETRLPVLKGTWAKDAGSSIAYYSDTEDPSHSTTDIGVPNTERGHCGKMEAIIKRFHRHFLSESSVYRWLIIADDDTLLSVPRLLRLLKCYNSSYPVLLGEVYGYLAHLPAGGTSYVTGGGSMVLSQAAVKSYVGSVHRCPSNDAADDMFLGSVAGALHWDIVHSPLFHQAQPDSFQTEVLNQQMSISFHRHRPKDPYQVYHDYLLEKETDGYSETVISHRHKTDEL